MATTKMTLEGLVNSFLIQALERAESNSDAMMRKEYIGASKLSTKLSVKQYEYLMLLAGYRSKNGAVTQKVSFEDEHVGVWEVMDDGERYTIIFYLEDKFIRLHPIAKGMSINPMVQQNVRRFKGREVYYRENYEGDNIEHLAEIEHYSRYHVQLKVILKEAFSDRVNEFHPKFYLADLAVLRPAIKH